MITGTNFVLPSFRPNEFSGENTRRISSSRRHGRDSEHVQLELTWALQRSPCSSRPADKPARLHWILPKYVLIYGWVLYSDIAVDISLWRKSACVVPDLQRHLELSRCHRGSRNSPNLLFVWSKGHLITKTDYGQTQTLHRHCRHYRLLRNLLASFSSILRRCQVTSEISRLHLSSISHWKLFF